MTINLLTNLSYPQNQSNNVPIGSSIHLVFDKDVDLESVKNSCILMGPDSSKTIMPQNAMWINESSGENKDFLSSPGYQGFCEFDIELSYLDTESLEQVDNVSDIDRTNYYSLAKITPKNALAINTEYKLFIIGANTQNLDPIYKNNKAVSLKTIYSPELDNLVDNRISIRGQYKYNISAQLNIKIIQAGIGSQAQYVYYFDDQQIDLSRGSRCSARWRSIDRGLVIKFDNIQYNLNEIITVKCYPVELLDDSYILSFTTGDGSVFIEPEPDYMSTSPINSAIYKDPTLDKLQIISITPYNGEINLPIDTNRIVIEFNKNLDPLTVTQETIKLQVMPVSGFFNNGSVKDRGNRLYKIISVEGNKIIIEF